MKRYGERYYKPDRDTFWEWSNIIDAIKADCQPGEHIIKQQDEHGRWYYQHVYTEGD